MRNEGKTKMIVEPQDPVAIVRFLADSKMDVSFKKTSLIRGEAFIVMMAMPLRNLFTNLFHY